MSKPELFILHGALGSSEQLKGLKQLLSEYFNVYDFNFSGHGGKPFSKKGFSIHSFTEELLEYMNANNIVQPNFFGYSMGGYVALNLAKQYPTRVKNIFTLATKFDWTPESAEKEVKFLNPTKIEEKVPQFAETLKKRHYPNDWKHVIENTVSLMLHLGGNPTLKIEDFKTITHKTTITVGTEDTMVSISESEKVANALPCANFYTFQNFKHPIEQVDIAILCKEIVKQLSL